MATLQNTTISSTGAITLPSGNNAARSAPNGTGNFRYNTTFSAGILEFWDGTNWRPVTGYSVGTIGTGGNSISYLGNSGGIVHQFTSVGSSTFTPAFTGTVQVLVVAGGGGGAGGHGGGGGGGGFIYNSTFPVSSGTPYPITVGGGGNAGPYGSMGGQGGSSVFSTITATGGGGGGGWQGQTGGSGGSGGGGGNTGDGANDSRVRIMPGNGTYGQGFPGGAGVRYTRQGDNAHNSGSGGGAGAPGRESPDQSYDRFAAWGGAGAASDILGNINYWGGGGGQGSHYNPGGGGPGGIGGGGGGACHHGGPQLPGTGYPTYTGFGGGVAVNQGQDSQGQTVGGAGGTNTGGGGGGGNAPGGTGGSGMVIIRY
jgi:hypothetical protein